MANVSGSASDCTIRDNCSYLVIWDIEDKLKDVISAQTKIKDNTEPIEHKTTNFACATINQDELSVATKYSCSVCKLIFPNNFDQTTHFKSEQHCLNLKRRIQGKETLKSDGSDSDLEPSDLSSSDAEEESALKSIELIEKQPKIAFEIKTGERLLIYKCLLFSEKKFVDDNNSIISQVKALPRSIHWTVILLSSEHFAAAVFEKNTIIVSKTFHRYTIRRKQGTAQSAFDRHGQKAKSAGASLRRYNELALNEEVTKLLESWNHLLQKCSHIFYRVCGSSRGMLFGGKKPIFSKNDCRLRRIPFATKRPTQEEVIRTQNKLQTVELFKDFSSISELFQKPAIKIESSPKKKHVKNSTKKDKAEKSYSQNGNRIPKKIGKPKRQENPDSSDCEAISTSDSEELCLQMEEKIVFTSDLKSFGLNIPNPEKSFGLNIPNPEKLKAPMKTDESSKENKHLIDDLYTACRVNNVDMAKKLILLLPDPNEVLNQYLGQNSTTLLHIASQGGFKELVSLLLGYGADPIVKDGSGRLPYNVAHNKETRSTFSEFSAKFPDKYNYCNSQIPLPPSEEERNLKLLKKQAQRQEKRQRLKTNKMLQEEKLDFLQLTDYEKSHWYKQRGHKMRCFECGELIEKIPFEYNDIKCCSVNCILKHRKIK